MSERGSIIERVVDNRPLQLLLGVVPAAAAAAAAGAFALLTSEIWELAVKLSAIQLIAANLLSIAAMVVWLIIAHELWVRSEGGHRAEVRQENTAMVLTVFIGVLAMYVSVFLISLLAEWIVLHRDVLRSTLRQPVDWTTYAVIAWFASSIATVGGAIGSGLESDEDVRAAVHGGKK